MVSRISIFTGNKADIASQARQRQNEAAAARGLVRGDDGKTYASQAYADIANARLQASQVEAQNEMLQLQLDQKDLQSRLDGTAQTSTPVSNFSEPVSGAFDEKEYQQIVDLTTLQSNQKIAQIDATGGWQKSIADAEVEGKTKVADLEGKWNLDAVREKTAGDLAIADKTIGGNIQIAGIQGETARDVASTEAKGKVDATRVAGEYEVAKADTLGSWQNKAAETTGSFNLEGQKVAAQGNIDTARVQGELQNIGYGIQGDYNLKTTQIEADTNKEIAFGQYASNEKVANITGEWTDKGYRTQGDEFRKTSAQESGQRIREQELARRGVQNSKREDGQAARNLYQQRAFG